MSSDLEWIRRVAGNFWQIWAKCRSLSAVSAPIFASEYAFFSIFQNLPDYLAEVFEIWQLLHLQNLINLQNLANNFKIQLDNLVHFTNTEKRVFTCKDRCRYIRKRAKFWKKCQNLATTLPSPCRGVEGSSSSTGLQTGTPSERAWPAYRSSGLPEPGSGLASRPASANYHYQEEGCGFGAEFFRKFAADFCQNSANFPTT